MIFHLKVQKQNEMAMLALEIVVKNAIIISLSDPKSPTFLAQLFLTPIVFQELAKEQELRMDFDEFVDQFKTLLMKEEWSKVFDNENNFKLVEITSWRALCHLKLPMSIPSMEIKNQYLADKLLLQADELDLCKSNSEAKSRKLQTELTQYSLKVKELQELLNNSNIKLKEQQDCNTQRIQAMEMTHQTFITSLQNDHNSIMNGLKTQISHISNENESLKSQLNVFKQQQSSLQNELNIAQQSQSSHFQDHQQLLNDCNSYKNQMGLYKNRLSLVESELQAKNQQLSNLDAKLHSEQQDKHNLHQKVTDLEQHLQSISHSVNDTNNEVNKGNDIIQQLEQELSSSKSKLKLSTQLALTQEQRIKEMSNELDKYKSINPKSNFQFDKLEHQNESLKTKLNFAQDRLEHQQGILYLYSKSMDTKRFS